MAAVERLSQEEGVGATAVEYERLMQEHLDLWPTIAAELASLRSSTPLHEAVTPEEMAELTARAEVAFARLRTWVGEHHRL